MSVYATVMKSLHIFCCASVHGAIAMFYIAAVCGKGGGVVGMPHAARAIFKM